VATTVVGQGKVLSARLGRVTLEPSSSFQQRTIGSGTPRPLSFFSTRTRYSLVCVHPSCSYIFRWRCE